MRLGRRELSTFGGLRRLIATLRGPQGCPWDRVQTHQSLRPFLLEEASEALAALDEGNPQRLQEELGDLLLQVLLHIQIAEEAGEFRLRDVVYGIAQKLVRRHPHVFGEAVAKTPQAVVEQWDELKRRERPEGGSALDGIPPTLPALALAQALQRRAVRAGFAWESWEQVRRKVQEELEEVERAHTAQGRQREIGDALFALAEAARWLEVDAEEALRSACRRFEAAFRRMEEALRESGRDLQGMALEEKLEAWRRAKKG